MKNKDNMRISDHETIREDFTQHKPGSPKKCQSTQQV